MPPITPIIQPSPVTIGAVLPSDPILRAMADEVIHKFCFYFTTVAAEEQPSTPGDLASTYRIFLNSRRDLVRNRYRESARALLETPVSARAVKFGRYAVLNVNDLHTLSPDILDLKLGHLLVNGEQLKQSLLHFDNAHETAPPPPTHNLHFDPVLIKDIQQGLKFKKMKLFIKRVTCIEDTDDGFLGGSDEILMGGLVVDPHGKTSEIVPFLVFDDFDKGEFVDYGFTKAFATWDLVTDENWPHVYSALIGMAERDNGGFFKFINNLWAKVKDDIMEYLKKAGETIFSYFFGKEMGAIGKVIGTIVGEVLNFIFGLFDDPDDLFFPRPLLMTLGTMKKSYYDWAKLTTAEGSPFSLHYKGSGGHYRVDCAFKVFTQ